MQNFAQHHYPEKSKYCYFNIQIQIMLYMSYEIRPPWLDLLWHRYIPRPTTCRHSHTTEGQRPHRVFVCALLWWVDDVMWYANSFTNLFFTCKCPTFPRSLFTLALRSSMKHTIYSNIIIDIWTAQPYLFSNKMYKLCMDMHKFQDLNVHFKHIL